MPTNPTDANQSPVPTCLTSQLEARVCSTAICSLLKGEGQDRQGGRRKKLRRLGCGLSSTSKPLVWSHSDFLQPRVSDLMSQESGVSETMEGKRWGHEKCHRATSHQPVQSTPLGLLRTFESYSLPSGEAAT